MSHKLLALALPLTLALGGCRPAADDAPAEIKNPKKELGPAKKKADEEAKKEAKKDKKLADAKAKKDQKPEPKPEPAAPAIKVGEPAPDFALKDLEGNEVKLSALKGKTVVLEWFNPECPFVVYAHGEGGPLRDMAKSYADKELVWLGVNSGAEGKQGAGLEKSKKGVDDYKMEHAVLLDMDGAVGKLYGAKTTPHMFVIDPEGKVAYMGGLDNAPRGKPQSGDAIETYTKDAIDAVLAGKAPERSESKPYGCSVKYGS